jgi:hypothetical protein
LDFLTDRPDVLALWKDFWPQRGRAQTWDGAARLLHRGDQIEWLLIEAKANKVEFVTPPTGASSNGGRAQILKSLNHVKSALGVHRHYPWHGTYYQYANRLAALYFLNEVAKVPARLLHIYFTGDCFPDGRECPASPEDWRRLIEARDITLGLLEEHPLSSRCHELFLSASGHAPVATS